MLQTKDDSNTLQPPDQFPFPFTPYPIQEGFMRALYAAIEGKKLGIFESPTGTGKSLSLICGSLSWLRDHEERERREISGKLLELEKETSTDNSTDTVDWFTQQTSQAGARQQRLDLKQEKDKIDKFDKNISKIREAYKKRKQCTDLKREKEKVAALQKQKLVEDSSKTNEKVKKIIEEEDDDIMLDEVAVLGKTEDDSDDEDTKDAFRGTQIFFCSRTHSQLAQFVGEVQRSAFSEDTRLVPLASRQNYCINEAVSKLKSMALINERCLDMQKHKGSKATKTDGNGVPSKKLKTSGKGCPFMSPAGSELLRESALCRVQDVEQLVSTGRALGACPYYATRAAVDYAQVVVVPYNTLLHKSTRKASGLKLAGSVVIIDEAHNLLEAIGHIHSSVVCGHQLAHAHSQLVQYRDKYQSRFSPSNLLFLNRLIFVINKLLRVVGGKPGKDPTEVSQDPDAKMLTLQEFMLTAEVDNINVYDLLEFCQKSKLSHKLHGYAEKYQPSVVLKKPDSTLRQENPTGGIRAFLKEIEDKDKGQNQKPATPVTAPAPALKIESQLSNNPLLSVIAFLETLTNDCEDGRFLIQKQKLASNSSLKFLLLNPASHFRDIVREARSVIVAGGTMQPLSEFQDELFKAAGGEPKRIMHFSCGHVVPPENILALAIGAGPSGKSLEFSYTSRAAPDTLNELSRLIENVARIVPGGVVCFFPSYDYEQLVTKHMEANSALKRIENLKKVFREPKLSSQVDEVLSQYAKCIRRGADGDGNQGALLFSVIGGKLSEGLNFSDDLGRCVIVVGLPYPNIKSPELQEQMKFLDKNVGPGRGREHLENLCMKAVNQSIGRAVRHKDDFATVLLVDRRYLQPARHSGLPEWIRRSLHAHEKFGPAFAMIGKFFTERKKRKSENC